MDLFGSSLYFLKELTSFLRLYIYYNILLLAYSYRGLGYLISFTSFPFFFYFPIYLDYLSRTFFSSIFATIEANKSIVALLWFAESSFKWWIIAYNILVWSSPLFYFITTYLGFEDTSLLYLSNYWSISSYLCLLVRSYSSNLLI